MGVQRMLTKSQFIYLLNKWLLVPDMRHELVMAFGVRKKNRVSSHLLE